MDKRLFGSSEMGDSSFKLIVRLFESMMDAIVQCFPDQVGLRCRSELNDVESQRDDQTGHSAFFSNSRSIC